MPYTTLNVLKNFKKCTKCKKRKGKIIANQLINNDIETYSLCIKCFKIFIPEYTLKKECFSCQKCFECDLQKILFTSKEINQLKIKLNYD